MVLLRRIVKAGSQHATFFRYRSVRFVASTTLDKVAQPKGENEFSSLGLGLDLVKGLRDMGVEQPTPVQRLFIPRLLKDGEKLLYGKSVDADKGDLPSKPSKMRNYVVASETGSGKTLAFLLPVIESIKRDEALFGQETAPRRPKALIVAPTRELAIQIGKVAKSLSHDAKIRVACFTGGTPKKAQNRRLENPLDIVIATPARALALRDKEERLFYGSVRYLVVDEADAMVGAHDGFREEMEALIGPMEKNGNLVNRIWVGATILSSKEREEVEKRKKAYGRDDASKTAMKWINEYVTKKNQELSIIKTDTVGKLPVGLKYRIAVGGEVSKHPALLSVMRGIVSMSQTSIPKGEKTVTRTLIFCNTIPSCQSTVHTLEEEKEFEAFMVYSINGSMPPKVRDRQWEKFNAGPETFLDAENQHKVLICTDIAARGLDFDRQIDHVVMFDLPDSVSDFIHRIGRTARGMEKRGGTVTLISKGTNRDKRNMDFLLSAVPADLLDVKEVEDPTKVDMPVPLQLHRPRWKSNSERRHRHSSGKHSMKHKLLRKRIFGKESAKNKSETLDGTNE